MTRKTYACNNQGLTSVRLQIEWKETDGRMQSVIRRFVNLSTCAVVCRHAVVDEDMIVEERRRRVTVIEPASTRHDDAVDQGHCRPRAALHGRPTTAVARSWRRRLQLQRRPAARSMTRHVQREPE